MSITFLMPYRFRKKGISRIHRVSDTWDREMSILECSTPKVPWNSARLPKSARKGLAKPLVICRATPSSIEKMKKMAIFLCLKRVKARRPMASTRDFFSDERFTGHSGRVSV